MPRAFTHDERVEFRGMLRDAARRSIARYGLRRTRVADLAADAGLSKGAFYIFYDSKEDLFLEVFALTEQEVRQELIAVAKEEDLPPRERVYNLLSLLFQSLERHPELLVLSQPDEARILWRAMPAGERESQREDDERFYESLFQTWVDQGVIEELDPVVLAGLPLLVSAVASERDSIGPDRFNALTGLLLEALADRLVSA